MTTTLSPDQLDQKVKARARAMWALGDYGAVAAEIVPDLGPRIVRACGVRPGQRVLDVAAGTGNAAVPAALLGADVTACDLTPELIDVGRRDAARRGAVLEWREADAEALPFADGEFDVVLSCLGVMFTPHHRVSAAELVRVCRPGGTIGLLNWTPEGFIGQMFATMKPYAPPPPPGAQPPPLWGREEHVRDLFGDHITDVEAHREPLTVEQFAAPEEFREYFKANYGPTIAVYRALADDPGRSTELDQALDHLAARFDYGTGAATVMDWEYLLFTARRTPHPTQP